MSSLGYETMAARAMATAIRGRLQELSENATAFSYVFATSQLAMVSDHRVFPILPQHENMFFSVSPLVDRCH